MMNPKFLLISAAVGFTASFIAGIIGKVFFGVILLRSLLFAFGAAAAAFGLRTLAVKFLLPAEDSILPEQAPAPAPGSAVDITLDDGELGDDGAMLNFSFQPVSIGQPSQDAFAPAGARAEKEAGENPAKPSAAQPVSAPQPLAETVKPTPSAAAEPETRQQPAASKPDLSSGLEILPDLDSITAGLDVSPAVETPPEGETPVDLIAAGGHQDFDGRPDASEMVKAIRTVLAKDD